MALRVHQLVHIMVLIISPLLQSKQKSIACETATRKTELGQKGLQLFPEVVNFGAIVEAGIYSQTVSVRNNGTKPARLKVKPPHGSIEMKLIYAPGPVSFPFMYI